MKALQFIPVVNTNIKTYVNVGIRSYQEHYLHLWKHHDPSPFIKANLTHKVVKRSLSDPSQKLFIISLENKAVGILALTIDASLDLPDTEGTVLLNKLYILKSVTGKGVGTGALRFLEDFAKQHHKYLIWLLTMQKGKPKHFYLKHGYEILRPAEIRLPNVLNKEKSMWLMVKRIPK